jgi:DHA1 family multidrug resistance protein-like MFS transporter
VPQLVKKVFPVLSLTIFSATLGVGIISPFLPLYAEDLGATGIWLGFIFAGFSISRTIVIPIAGRLADRRGRKLILAIGLFSYTILSLGYVWIDTLAGLTIVRLLHGLASGMVLPIAQAYVGDIVPEGGEGKWMGYFNAAFFTGIGCGPLIGGILAEHLGMDAAFYAMGCLSLLAFLGVILFLPEISARQKATGLKSSYRDIAANRHMRGLFSMRLGFSTARGALATFLPIFAGINLGLSTSSIGILLTVNMLGMSLLQIPAGVLADRLNKRAMVVLGCTFYVVVMVLIPAASNFWQLLALSVFLGVGGATAMPAASVLVVDQGRRYGMGMVMAAFFMAVGIGMAIGPILGGVIADFLSTGHVFYFSAASVLAGTIVFSWYTRRGFEHRVGPNEEGAA